MTTRQPASRLEMMQIFDDTVDEEEKQRKLGSMSIGSQPRGIRGVSMDVQTSWSTHGWQSTNSSVDNMARFQQKQLQEKEQKLLQLYDQQQQRAYQVVQRGSAGSNASNGSTGSNVNQQTVSRMSTTTYATSHAQGGKVRQMFDERRQTTKGIDRSYPLEPLDDKLTKQWSSSDFKNGNQSKNRQFVAVRTVTRGDVNSNVNGGKPLVSYYEEVSHTESHDNQRRNTGEREKGSYTVNRHEFRTSMKNGNRKDDEEQLEETLDSEAIERNRMMAKIHLMDFDESMKHRVRNDLESEQFPEDLMIDVPDKLPKKNPTKKLTQAEARLARFKHTNAKKDNLSKNPTTTATRKIKEQTLPVRSTVRNQRYATGENVEQPKRHGDYEAQTSRSRIQRSTSPEFFRKELEKGAGTFDVKSRSSPEIALQPPSRHVFQRKKTSETARYSETIHARQRQRTATPEFFCRESETSATTYSLKPRPKNTELSSSRDVHNKKKSKTDFNRQENVVDSQLKMNYRISDKIRSPSPEFFCKESETSATTYSLKPRTKSTELSSSDVVHNKNKSKTDINRQENIVDSQLKTNYRISDKIRSPSPEFFCRESETSATTYSLKPRPKNSGTKITDLSDAHTVSSKLHRFDADDSEFTCKSKTTEIGTKQTSEYFRNAPSPDPEFYCKESKTLATTFSLKPKPVGPVSQTRQENAFQKRSASIDFSAEETRDSSMEQAQSSTVKLSQKYTDAAKIIDTSDSEKESQDRRSRRAETHHGYFDETESSILKRKKRDVERSNRVRNIYKTRAYLGKNRNLKDKKPTRISSGALKSVNVLRGIMKNGGKEDCPSYVEAPISTGGKSSFSAESSVRNKGRSIFQKYQITCSLKRSPSVKQLRSIEDIRKSIRRISDVHLVSPSAVITLSRQLQPKFVITSNKRKECSAVKEEKQRRVVGKEVSNCEFLKDIRNVRSGKPGNGIFDGKFNHCRTTKSPSPDSPEKKSGETSVRSTVRRTTTILTNSPSRNTAILSRDSKTPSKETTTKGSEVRANELSPSTINKSLDLVDNEESRGNYSAAENKGKTVDESEQSPTNPLHERTEFKENNLEISRKSPAKKQQTSERSSSRPNSSTSSASSPSSMHASSVRDKMTTKVKTGTRSPKIPSAPSKSAKSAGNIGNIADNLVACKVCGRRFAHERIVLHEQICSKAAQKKRKQFDAMMFRVKGTDLEPFVKKGTPKKQTEVKAKKPEVKSNWRRKHEDFINAIRSAKQVQAHLAAGGKLSDLPPPPVSDTSDYIQCPHCGRKFNEAAAQRHIPKCENMLHNKPSNARAPFRSKR